MTTLSLGHDVSECVFVYFDLAFFKKKCKKIIKSPKNGKKPIQSPKKKIVRAPHTPKILGAVVRAQPDRALSQQERILDYFWKC